MIVDRQTVAAALPGFDIGERLGAGAFGLVLAGRQRSLNREVAIKVLPAAQEGNSGFGAEAQLLARLDHPHIVRVYDYIETAELSLVVMELLAGGTLARRRMAGITAETACGVGLAVASGLAYAHDAGVLHRDIKSDNVMFDAAGVVKVTDFGIAKLLESSAATASAQVGTPLYMAPEQIIGGRLGPPTDVYALGVLLYQLLAGVPPFPANLPLAVLWQHHLTAAPAPPAGVPLRLTTVLLRALAKDPGWRHPTAHAFALDLAAAATTAYGPGWLGRSGLRLWLDDEVRRAAVPPWAAMPGPPAAAIPGAGPVIPGPPPVGPPPVGPAPFGLAGAAPARGGHAAAGPGPTGPAAQPGHPPGQPGQAMPGLGAASTPGGPAPSYWGDARQPVDDQAATRLAGGPAPSGGNPWAAPYDARRSRPRRRGSRRVWGWAGGGAAVAGVLALVLVLLLLPGSKPGRDARGATASPATSATRGLLDPAVTSARVLHPSTRKGGTLRVLADSDCDYWDPQRTYYGNCWSQLRWFSRQLLTYTRAPMSTELVGDLATAPARSTDRRTWTYTLREGIRFEDGTPITSRDIKYAVERVFATDVVSGGPTYVIDYLQTNPPYGGPYTDTSPEKLGLTSVETPDDRTIVFHLNKPFGDWNRVMAMPTTTPVPRARDTAARYTDHPVSSGPYKIESYEVGKKLVLVRNDQWNPATDPVNKALPDRIEETMGLDLDAIDSRILAGDGDVVAAQNGVQEAARARLVADPTLRSSRTSLDHNGFLRYLSVTMTVKPFDNIHCRKAVAWAVDRQAQIEARGGSTAGDVATTMLPPTLRYYQPFDLYPSTDGRGSVAKAREELAACGHPDGFATTLVTQDAAKYKAQADALTASLKRVGISVTVKAFPADRYYSAELGVPATMQRNGYGLAIAVWGSDWPSASGFLGPIVDGRKIFPAGNSNYAELDSKTVNDGIDAGLAASDDGVAQRAWTAVDRAVVDSAAYIPLIYDKAFNVYSDRVTNIVYSPAYNVIDFASLGVTG